MSLHIANELLRIECYTNILCIVAGVAVIAWCASVAADTIRDLVRDWRVT